MRLDQEEKTSKFTELIPGRLEVCTERPLFWLGVMFGVNAMLFFVLLVMVLK